MKGWYGNRYGHSLASKGIKFSDVQTRKIVDENPDKYETIRYVYYLEDLKKEMNSEITNTSKLFYMGYPIEILSRDELFGEILDKVEQDRGLDDSFVWRLNEVADELYDEYKYQLLGD